MGGVPVICPFFKEVDQNLQFDDEVADCIYVNTNKQKLIVCIIL